jgi:ATP-dependent RNA helicase RhlE
LLLRKAPDNPLHRICACARIKLHCFELGLHDRLLDGIHAMNFNMPTPIQEQAIPIILEGRDLIGIAQTGTGKTAAFTLPVLDLIMDEPDYGKIQALIIVPTRELAIQIDKAVEAYAYFTGASSVAVYGGGGGHDFNREKEAITRGVDIIIATPGRLLAHMNMGYVDFSKIRFLVLDEADRMLDMGFLPDLQRIINTTSPKRQTLLFSATMPPLVMKLARSLMKDPATISIALSKPAAGVKQGVYLVDEEMKLALLQEVLRERAGLMTLMFSSTKQNVSKLYQRLSSKGFNIGQISSDLDQKDRERVMLEFRNRKIDILVATDVVSRGIDIDGIELVINFDVPQDAEDYVHRIGRTARAARTGEAITLVSPAERGRHKRIESLIGSEIPRLPLPPGLEGKRPESLRESGRDRGRPKGQRGRPNPAGKSTGTEQKGGGNSGHRRNRPGKPKGPGGDKPA